MYSFSVLFLTMVMTLNAMSLLFATLVINIKKKGDREFCPEVPHYLMFICKRFLARVTCTKLLTYYDIYDSCGGLKLPKLDDEQETSLIKTKHIPQSRNKDGWMTETQRRQEEKQPQDLRLEWHFVAQVIDKSLFIVFVTASALTVAFTLIIIPAMHAND